MTYEFRDKPGDANAPTGRKPAPRRPFGWAKKMNKDDTEAAVPLASKDRSSFPLLTVIGAAILLMGLALALDAVRSPAAMQAPGKLFSAIVQAAGERL